jgi:hypothetical protein
MNTVLHSTVVPVLVPIYTSFRCTEKPSYLVVTISIRLAHFYGASRPSGGGVKLFGPTTSHYLDLMTIGSSKNKPTQTDRRKDAMCLRNSCVHHHKMVQVATTLDLSTVTRHNITKILKTKNTKGSQIELYLSTYTYNLSN